MRATNGPGCLSARRGQEPVKQGRAARVGRPAPLPPLTSLQNCAARSADLPIQRPVKRRHDRSSQTDQLDFHSRAGSHPGSCSEAANAQPAIPVPSPPTPVLQHAATAAHAHDAVAAAHGHCAQPADSVPVDEQAADAGVSVVPKLPLHGIGSAIPTPKDLQREPDGHECDSGHWQHDDQPKPGVSLDHECSAFPGY